MVFNCRHNNLNEAIEKTSKKLLTHKDRNDMIVKSLSNRATKKIRSLKTEQTIIYVKIDRVTG